MDAPPALTVQDGTVEEWTIQNRSEMDHAFHIHQIHFQTLAVNGQTVNDPTMRDTINVPHWSGNSSDPYPSVTLLMDFRDPNIVGTFVYHCHILGHEDLGMMGAIQILPASTTTALAASTTTPVLGQTVTFTATVTGAGTTSPPSGTVTFYDGTTVLGIATLDSSGNATFATKALTLGAHSITAVYAGDASFTGSTSSAVTVTVSPATTTTTLTVSTAHPVLGQTITFTATVTGFNSTVNPETVTFYDGTRVVGTAAMNSSGVATFSTKSFKLGTYWIHAYYPGDTWFTSSSSWPIEITVSPATTTTKLTASTTTPALGQSVTFTAAVTGFNSAVDIEPVTFYDGTTDLGTASLNNSGTAAYTTSALSAGVHSITATYPGDTWFASSTSPVVNVTVGSGAAATNFTLGVNPAALAVAQGQSGTAQLTITPANGFSSPISFSCSGLPAGTQCSFSPQSVTPTGANAMGAQLTITTPASNAQLQPGRSSAHPFYALLLPGLGAMLGWVGRKKKSRLLCLLLMLLSVTSFMTACGINANGVSSSITITASSSGSTAVSHSTALKLTITP
jgi:hypothetical protein